MPPERKKKPRSPAQAALGRAVELAMNERGMTQHTLAKKAGMDGTQISALVCGQANPTYDSLKRLCDGLDMPLSELMRRADL